MLAVDSIFFDVDGTLVDSTIDIANAVNYALRTLKLAERPKDDIASYIGTGVKDLVKKSLGSADAALNARAEEMFSRYYAEHPADNSILYPHVKEVLEYFQNKKKYIATNRYKKFADITLKKLGIRDYFEDIFGGDNENCLKPSACILDSFILKSHIREAKSVIVGDMAIDIQTGKNLRMKTCWVTYGLGKREDVEPLRPDFIIDDLIELKGIIQ